MEVNLDQLKSQYLQTEISAGTELRIKQTINSIEDTTRAVCNRNVIDWRDLSQVSSGKLRKTAIVAVVVIACTTVLSLGAPQKAFSMLQSVFSHFAKENGLNENYDKFAKTINATAANNGIEISLDKCVADSLGFTFSYRLRTEKPIKGGTLVLSKVLIDGKEISPEGSSSVYKDLGNNQYEGYQNLKLKNLPAEFNIEVEISQIGDVIGKWQVKMQGSTDETLRQSYFSSDSFEKTSPNGTLRISKIMSTPLNTMVTLTYKSNQPIGSNDYLPWASVMLLTQNNKSLPVDSFTSKVIDEFTYETEFYVKDYRGSLSELRIVPYLAPEKPMGPRSLDQDNDFYSLAKKVPYSWQAGVLGSVRISSVQESKDKITVICSINGKYADLFRTSIGVSPKVDTHDNSKILNFNPIYYNLATEERLKNATSWQNISLEFEKDPSYKGDYMMVFQKYYQQIKVYEDLEITIPIR